jgi:electron transfer flavoprotein beta subunit
MALRIAVLLKQVQKAAEVKMNEDFTIDRSGGNKQLNPADKSALLMGIALRKKYGGEIICLTMGPFSAVEVLREAAMEGADKLYHISDTLYAGSDTLATSLILAHALTCIGKPPLVLCGRRAIDGETGQIGPEAAVWLGFKGITNVISLEEGQEEYVIVKRLLEKKIQTLTVPLPAVISICETNTLSQLPSLKTIRRASSMPIELLSNQELKIDPERCGSRGSPTKVIRIHRKHMEHRKMRHTHSIKEGLDILEPVFRKFL